MLVDLLTISGKLKAISDGLEAFPGVQRSFIAVGRLFRDIFQAIWMNILQISGIMTKSRGHLEATLGPSWGYQGVFEAILGLLGAIWRHFEAILGPSWAILGLSGGVKIPSKCYQIAPKAKYARRTIFKDIGGHLGGA